MSDQFKMTGTIKMIGQTQNVSEKFSKREFVVVHGAGDKYPQDIMFQCTQDKCSLLDNFMEGQEVEVSFNLRGRGWTNPQGEVKYFNTLECWRLEAGAVWPAPTPVAQTIDQSAGDDDLPF